MTAAASARNRRVLGLLLGTPLVCVAVVLASLSDTWRGVVCASSLLFVGAALLTFGREATRWRWSGLVASFVCALVLVSAVPSRPSGDVRWRAEWPGRSEAPWSPLVLVDEGDLLSWGLLLAALAPNVMSFDEADRLRAAFRDAMVDARADAELRAIPTFLGDALNDLFVPRAGPAPLLMYVPPERAGRRLCGLVFVHGFGGNFRAFGPVMRRLADAAHCAAVLPSFGAGHWWSDDGPDVIAQALQRLQQLADVDGDRLVLVGLSNGGFGVTRAALDARLPFAGLAYLSAIVETEHVVTEAFIARGKDRAFLFLHGFDDTRVPPHRARAAAEVLAEHGLHVTTAFRDGADHFAILREHAWVESTLVTWIDTLPVTSNH